MENEKINTNSPPALLPSPSATMGEARRLNYIDWAKAISIILIVLGHLLPSGCAPKTLAYAFHVPIFAMIGGLLVKAPMSWKDYGKKCWGLFKRLFVPYLIWFIVFSSFYWISEESIPKVVAKYVVTDFTELLKYFTFYNGNVGWCAPMWFMPCYIVISLLFLAFTRLTKGNRFAALGLALTSLVVAIIFEKCAITLPADGTKDAFRLKNYFILLGFLAIGYSAKPLVDKCSTLTENPRKNPVPYAAIVLFVISAIVCLNLNTIQAKEGMPTYYSLSMFSGKYNEIITFICCALFLSFTLTLALMLFPNNKVIQLLSRNSLFIMLTHYFFFLEESFTSLKKAEWVLDMKLGFRDAAFIIVAYLIVLCLLDALAKKFPKLKKGLILLGISVG